jgi:hypothetical protein
MKKIVRLTESDLTRIVERIVNESDRVYGHQEINKLYPKLSDDEDVWLDDSSGDLSGQIVKKIDYVKDMLAMAVKKQDWSMVGRAINYLRIKL